MACHKLDMRKKQRRNGLKMENRKSFFLNRPAKNWEDGLPVGNGRIGAMILGGLSEESIPVNEETLWYGPPRDRANKDCRGYLDRVRELLQEGKEEEAAFLWKMAFTSTPKYNNPYQPAGEMHLCFRNHRQRPENYERRLELSTGEAEVTYTMGGYHYERTYLVSTEWNVLAVRLATDHPEGMTLSTNIGRKPFEEYTGALEWRYPAVGNWGQNGAGGVSYFTAVTAVAVAADGREEDRVAVLGDYIYVSGAKEVIFFLSTATSFKETCKEGPEEDKKEVSENIAKRVGETLQRARDAGWQQIRERHRTYFRQMYDRFSLTLHSAPSVPADILPMNEIMAEIRKGEKKWADGMMVFLLDYARYLMISSSANCVLPANLQGIWNGSFVPPWQSEFTININLEMNYWFVPKVGLTECEVPLRKLLQRLRKNGRDTAMKLYGCRGFCAHHNTNLWASADPEGIFDASPFWNMGGAWLALQVYDNYLYGKEKELLEQEILPTMREAILFFEDYLFEDREGMLQSGPSVSPENTYRTEEGQCSALCLSPAMDIAILRQLILCFQEGLEETGREREKELDTLLTKLPPYRLSKDGRLMEWNREVEETEPGHRHISHLFGLHPGNTITRKDKELFQAAGRTLDYRLAHGGGHTGWSKAWICCFMARLGRGEETWNNLYQMMQNCILDSLLDVHPPFQIDGNFGLAEAVLEMIAQSHDGCIELLPALPEGWRAGEIKGMHLRGGITMDLLWEEGIPVSCRMKAAEPVTVSVCFRDRIQKIALAETPREIMAPA